MRFKKTILAISALIFSFISFSAYAEITSTTMKVQGGVGGMSYSTGEEALKEIKKIPKFKAKLDEIEAEKKKLNANNRLG